MVEYETENGSKVEVVDVGASVKIFENLTHVKDPMTFDQPEEGQKIYRINKEEATLDEVRQKAGDEIASLIAHEFNE